MLSIAGRELNVGRNYEEGFSAISGARHFLKDATGKSLQGGAIAIEDIQLV